MGYTPIKTGINKDQAIVPQRNDFISKKPNVK